MSYNGGEYLKKEVNLMIKFNDLNPCIAVVEIGTITPIGPLPSLPAKDL